MKKLLNIFLILLVVTGLNSCFEELLEPVPVTYISDLSAFDTEERIESQIKGVYSGFKSGQYLGGRFQVYNSIRSDDFLNLQANGVTGYQTWGHNLTPSSNEVINLWGAIYAAVNRVNMFIGGLEDNEDYLIGENVISQEVFNQYMGEAIALRGMAYHHIIQLYAQPYNKNPQLWGAILRITPQRSSADNDMPRSTLEETYAQILQDLSDAEALLPDVSGANRDEFVTRVTKNTVIAFKTRVYLHMNDYANVIEEGNKIVSTTAPFSSPSGVVHALHEDFEEIFTEYTTSESIFSIPMTSTELPGTQNGLAHYFSAAPIGQNEYPINENSIVWTSTAFSEDDARKLLIAEGAGSATGHMFIDKYKESPHLDWAPVIRYAEVILNLAEAEAVNNGFGNGSRAVALLNAVYLRSNPSEDPLGDFASLDAFKERLMLERSLEFLGEGIKNMDTQRTLGTHAAKEGVEAVGPESNRYVWPISQQEFNTNSLVQPN